MSEFWQVWFHGFWPGLCVGMLVYHNVVGWVYLPKIEELKRKLEEK